MQKILLFKGFNLALIKFFFKGTVLLLPPIFSSFSRLHMTTSCYGTPATINNLLASLDISNYKISSLTLFFNVPINSLEGYL